MIEEPERHLEDFARAGSNIITIHAEACPHLLSGIQKIKKLGVKAGVSINPGTSLSTLDEVLPGLDLVLIMSVNPGFSGQPFIEEMVDKIARLRRILDERKLNAELEVDGGITAQIAPKVVAAGARVLVAGSAVFNKKQSIAQAIAEIKDGLGKI
jgi:ribulose-phosphate 3-epimerase